MHIQGSYSFSNSLTQLSGFAFSSVHAVKCCNSCRWKHLYALDHICLCLLINSKLSFCGSIAFSSIVNPPILHSRCAYVHAVCCCIIFVVGGAFMSSVLANVFVLFDPSNYPFHLSWVIDYKNQKSENYCISFIYIMKGVAVTRLGRLFTKITGLRKETSHFGNDKS